MEPLTIGLIIGVPLGILLLCLIFYLIYRKCCFYEGIKIFSGGKNAEYSVVDMEEDMDEDMLDGDLETDGRRGRRPTLDLHGLSRQKAMQKVEHFIQQEQTNFKENRGSRYVNVITGRGLHSTNNFPVLKDATQKYLKKTGKKYTVNSKGGQLVVDLKN